jgi:hypothetical protein
VFLELRDLEAVNEARCLEFFSCPDALPSRLVAGVAHEAQQARYARAREKSRVSWCATLGGSVRAAELYPKFRS